MHGFRKAMENALDNIGDSGWTPGGPYDAEITFGAKVSVTNPGKINEYIVHIG